MPSIPNPVDELIAAAGFRAAIIRPMQVDGRDYAPGEVTSVEGWRRITSLIERRFIRPWPTSSETFAIEIDGVERLFIDEDHAQAAFFRAEEVRQQAEMEAEIADIEVSESKEVIDLNDDAELEAAIAAMEAEEDADEDAVVVSTPRNRNNKKG